MDPRPPSHAPEDTLDEGLRKALVALPADGSEVRLDGLNRRVLAQWEAAHGHAAVRAGGDGRAGLTLGSAGRRASCAAAAGLLAGIALVLHVWLRAPDPALDELLQPDVLSQMAAGEM